MSESNAVVEGAEVHPSVRSRRGARRVVHEIRFTAAEWEAIVKAAAARRQTGIAFVYHAALGVLPSGQSTEGNAPLIRDLGRCGTALATLAATARTTGALPQASSVEAALVELLAVVRRVAKPEHPSTSQ
jgi:hypothetical protein